MRKLLELFLLGLFKLALKVRYRVTVKGLENIKAERLKRKGGILFLPNHPAILADPLLVGVWLWGKFRPRPIIVEYMYYSPMVNTLMRFINALPIPNFSSTSNSIKRRRSEKSLQQLVGALHGGDNVLLYPAGRTKNTGYEEIGGASGVYKVLQEVDDVNVVLVRTTGLWGSSFSRAFTDGSPPMFPTLFRGIKHALKNLIVFTPKRDITVELEIAPDDFPYNAEKMELNRWLEEWYNRPFEGKEGEPLKLVPYSAWSSAVPKAPKAKDGAPGGEDIADVPEDVQLRIRKEVAKLANTTPDQISPDMHLSSDLGLDSLDIAEVSSFLGDSFGVKGVATEDMTTVAKLMTLAVGHGEVTTVVHDDDKGIPSQWTRDVAKGRIEIPEGDTLQEAFLTGCDRFPKRTACSDDRSGVLTYKQLKMRAILLSKYIRTMPGDSVGVMLPASVAANIVVMACLLAKKTPVMINWTVGPRHLDSVVEVSGIKAVLSAWSFVDKLENVEFGALDDMMVMLEDVRKELSLGDKISSVLLARKNAKSLLRSLELDTVDPDSPAVMLFTSGTEAQPKGVPLTHSNLLSNLRGAMEAVPLDYSDVLLSILPPFHSFGFTITGILPILAGIRVTCFPDPTDGTQIAHAIKRWQCTLVAAAPSFLKGIFGASEAHHLQSVRMFVTGAEKTPPELFRAAKTLAPDSQLVEGYGITECSPVITFNPVGGSPRGVGRPIPGVELTTVNAETHEPVELGRRGLILCRGPNVFKGYLNPGLKSPFLSVEGKDWYVTGDLGTIDDEGYLHLAGRLKRFVKIGGEMVSLRAVEDALLEAAPELEWKLRDEGPSVAVCAREAEGAKTALILFSTFETSPRQVNKALKSAGFSNIVRVSEINTLEELPLMGSGKIHYRQLEEQYLK